MQRCNDALRCLAIIECEDAEKWQGYTERLWKQALEEPGDQWTVFKAYEGELPAPEAATHFDAIVIAGSHYSAYEEHDWIHKLLDLLPKYAAQGTRMYGCCFGCQILARALGGSIGPNPDGNFVLTIEQIRPTQQLQQFHELHAVVQQAMAAAADSSSSRAQAEAAASSTGDSPAAAAVTAIAGQAGDVGAAADALDQLSLSTAPPAAAAISDQHTAAAAAASECASAARSGCFCLIESHGDQVLDLPPGAALLASSATATNELWCWGPNVLASQFHVEFDKPLVLQKIWASLRDVGRLTPQQAEQSRRVLEAGGQQNGNMLQVIKHFLRHGIVGAAPVDNSSICTPSSCSTGGSGDAPGAADSAAGDAAGDGGLSSSNCSSSSAVGAGSSNSGPTEPSSTQQQQQQHNQQEHQQGQSEQQQNQLQGDSASPAAADSSGQMSTLPTLKVLSAAAAAAGSSSWPSGWPSGLIRDASRDDSRAGGLEQGLEHQTGGKGGSGCSSPTAASEHSVATASTSSAVPFSHIAYQRRQHKREQELTESSQRMVNDAAAAFDLRMECYSLDLVALQQVNDAAAEQYSSTAEIGTALGQFVGDLGNRQAAVRDALAMLPQLDRQLKLLEGAVGQLDRRSRELEGRLGLAGSGRSSAYEYLASSFSRAGSSVGAAAVGAGGCLGGGALPKQ